MVAGVKQKLVQHLSSVENAHRRNTIAIDLSNIFGRDAMPNRLDMFKFVHKKMGIKAEELLEIQSHPFLPQVFVKMKSEDVMVRTEDKIKAGLKMESRNITLHGWRCDIPLTTVKLNGVNYDTTRERVVEIMSKYGKVESIERGRIDYFKECFVSDGTWLLRIRTEQGKGLPSTLYYEDEKKNVDIWSLIFDGKVSACYKCGDEGHRGDRCRAAKPKPADSGMIAPVGIGTYCDVVKAGVQVEWKGMSDKGDYSKQVSLKPMRVGKNVRQPQVASKDAQGRENICKADVLPLCPLLPRVECGGFSHSSGAGKFPHCSGDGSDVWFPKLTNRFSVISDKMEDEVLGEEMQEKEVHLAPQGVKRGRVKSKPDNVREVKKKGEEGKKTEEQAVEIQDSEVETEVEMAASVNLLAQVEDKEENVPTQIEQVQQLGGGQGSQLEGEALGGTVPGQVKSQALGRSRIYPRRKERNKGGKVSSEGKEYIDSEGESDEEEEDESLKTGEVLSSESAAFDFKKALETRAKTQF